MILECLETSPGTFPMTLKSSSDSLHDLKLEINSIFPTYCNYCLHFTTVEESEENFRIVG